MEETEFQEFKQIIELMDNQIYVADHLIRIERKYINEPSLQLKSLSLIAHSVGLFRCSFRLLTEDEEVRTRRFLTVFRMTSKGHNAILTVKKFPRWKTAA